MRHIEHLLRNTVKLVKATNLEKSVITLFKVPGTQSVRSSYSVVCFDDNGLEINRYSFRHFRRLVDAEKVYDWVRSLAYSEVA